MFYKLTFKYRTYIKVQGT